jgi:opacity protein-like surface antigen
VLVVSTSRRESSWYFGDGAILFDQAATALAANPVAMTAPFAARVVTLDPVLGRSLGEIRRGGIFGARVSRALNARFAAELSFDYGLARLDITKENSQAIEATRSSFATAFTGLITSNTGRTLRGLSSTAELERASARQLVTTGALLVNLRTTGGLTPYATIGVSLLSIVGDRPSASLTGNYQFSNATGAIFNETDNVTVRDARDRTSLAGIVGGGVKYHVARRWGLRLDARVSLSRSSTITLVDAVPNVSLGQLPAGRVTLNANPTIQFGNSSNAVTAIGVTGIAPSTLSGAPLTGFRTWSGSGVSSQTNITAGIFWRF